MSASTRVSDKSMWDWAHSSKFAHTAATTRASAATPSMAGPSSGSTTLSITPPTTRMTRMAPSSHTGL